MSKTIIESIELVKTSASSIFTKEDVIKILESISIESVSEECISEELSEKILELVRYKIEHLEYDEVVELGSAEFSLNGNEINLDSIEVLTDTIYEAIESEISSFVK